MNKQLKTTLYGVYIKDLRIFEHIISLNGYGGHIKLIFMVGIFNHLPVNKENIIKQWEIK